VLAGVLAAVSPANTPHGSNLTFAFPMLLFIVIAGALYLRVRSPHRVPGHAPLAAASPAGTTPQDARGGPDGRNGQDGPAVPAAETTPEVPNPDGTETGE
jgi:hypothetical protein